MTPEQAARLRLARDTMPENLITKVLYCDDGVCAVGHLATFADVPIEWIRGRCELSERVEAVLIETFGFSNLRWPYAKDADDIGWLMSDSDRAHPDERSAAVTERINTILAEHGYEP